MAETTSKAPPRENERGVRFDLSGFRRVSVQSFRLAEITGDDRKAAAQRSASTQELSDELLAQSITEVDDAPVERPFHGFQSWSSRTIEFLETAWQGLNGATKKETDDFLTQALGAPPKPSK